MAHEYPELEGTNKDHQIQLLGEINLIQAQKGKIKFPAAKDLNFAFIHMQSDNHPA